MERGLRSFFDVGSVVCCNLFVQHFDTYNIVQAVSVSTESNMEHLQKYFVPKSETALTHSYSVLFLVIVRVTLRSNFFFLISRPCDAICSILSSVVVYPSSECYSSSRVMRKRNDLFFLLLQILVNLWWFYIAPQLVGFLLLPLQCLQTKSCAF